MLPTAVRALAWLTFLLYAAAALVVASALLNGGATKAEATGAGIGSAIPGLVLIWVLLAAADWLETRPCPRWVLAYLR
jgi:hypothetical protein